MSTYLTPSTTMRGWLDIHINGRSHRTVTWKDRFETCADGYRHLIAHVYTDGDFTKPFITIPMDGDHSKNRVPYVFEELDKAGHPTDSDKAFDFGPTEKEIADYVSRNLPKCDIIADPDIDITVKAVDDKGRTRFLVNYNCEFRAVIVDDINEVATIIARELYPVAAMHEHDPRG